MNDIKVSIMIPAYNVEEYIERCIRSAMQQTLQEIEIIVVDDGSTDKTSQIIATLAEEDSRIVVVEKENGGLPSARNASLDVARGKYIQTLDGDDWIEPAACEELYKYAEANDLDIVATDCILDNDNGEQKILYSLGHNSTVMGRDKALEKVFTEPDSGMLCNKFIKSELFQNIRLPENISYGEDLVTTVRLLINAKKVGKYNGAFYHYIDNPKGISKEKVAKKMYQYFEGFEIIREKLDKAKLLNTHEKKLMILEQKKITSFMSHSIHLDDNGYTRGLDKVIKYVTQNRHVSKNISLPRRFFMHILVAKPTKENFIFLAKVSYFLKKILESIRFI